MSQETEFEAAAFRRLLAHLQTRSDVQNIDLMALAGFCRNCLADWYRDAALEDGTDMSRESAREKVYGMPFPQWKAKYQKEASPAQLAAFEAAQSRHKPRPATYFIETNKSARCRRSRRTQCRLRNQDSQDRAPDAVHENSPRARHS